MTLKMLDWMAKTSQNIEDLAKQLADADEKIAILERQVARLEDRPWMGCTHENRMYDSCADCGRLMV